jgi:FMN phosphatase YigB (HAD superfamily)
VYSDYPLEEKLEALLPFKPDFAFSANDAEINCLKPNKKGLSHIVNVLKLPVEDIVFIGDRFEKDAVCAKQTGMDYIILSHSFLIRNKNYKKYKIQ